MNIIYYFTGTGNSLAAARDLAVATGAELVPMAAALRRAGATGGRISPAAASVGIIFPVYYTANDGLPLIVRRFVGALDGIKDTYLWSAAVCGTNAGPANKSLRTALARREGTLDGGFSVRLPNNTKPFPSPAKQAALLAAWTDQCEDIAAYVQARATGTLETTSRWAEVLFWPLGLAVRPIIRGMLRRMADGAKGGFAELIPQADRGFKLTDACNGCGTCATVCPVRNIEMHNGKPAWQHRCETCVACVHWCPQSAILCSMIGSGRYRHPGVTLQDMAAQAGD